MYLLYIFDFDGTLVPFGEDTPYPGRIELIKRLVDNGKHVGIATNQGGVGCRRVAQAEGWPNPQRFPTQAQVDERILRFERLLKGHGVRDVLLKRCYWWASKQGSVPDLDNVEAAMDEWNPTWRKPQPGMLNHIMQHFGVEPEYTLYIGDADDLDGEDIIAASNAGCAFLPANQIESHFI